MGEGELGLGTFPHDGREIGLDGFVDRPEHVAGGRKPVREILPHAYALCPLAGAQQHHPYHRTTMLAQVKPPPNATINTVAPGPIRPDRTHSSSAMGMEAAEVLP